MKNRFGNTYGSGKVTFLFMKEKGKYIGVCLEFDLIVQTDTFSEAVEEIEDYAKLWHRNIVKNRLSEKLLNKPAPRKYWEIHEKLLRQNLKRTDGEQKNFPSWPSALANTGTCQYPYSDRQFTFA